LTVSFVQFWRIEMHFSAASGQSLQLYGISVDQGELLGSRPALELAFAFDGGRAIWMKFRMDNVHGPKERGCSAARPGLVLGEAAGKIVG
jgi:hypothetical protein